MEKVRERESERERYIHNEVSCEFLPFFFFFFASRLCLVVVRGHFFFLGLVLGIDGYLRRRKSLDSEKGYTSLEIRFAVEEGVI